MKISFDKPPLNEVVVGSTVAPLHKLLIPHYGRFWDLIQHDFPLCEHAPPIIEDSGFIFDEHSGAPLPRVWFLNHDKTRLLQLQRDRFYCNWRQTTTTSTYGRFNSVYEPFCKYWDVLAAFAAAQLGVELTANRHSITYVSLFQQGQEWNNAEDISQIFKDIKIPIDNAFGKIQTAAINLTYKIPDAPGSITLILSPAQEKQTLKELLRLEITASCAEGDLKGLSREAWFSQAHQAIVQGFCDVTTDRAQAAWQRTA